MLEDFYFDKNAKSLHFVFKNGGKGQPFFSRKEALLAFFVLRFKGDITPGNSLLMIGKLILSIDLLPYHVGEREYMVNYIKILKEKEFISEEELNEFKKGLHLKEASKVLVF